MCDVFTLKGQGNLKRVHVNKNAIKSTKILCTIDAIYLAILGGGWLEAVSNRG